MKITMEMTLEEVGQEYAREERCYLIKYDLMEELLKLPGAQDLCIFDALHLIYLSRPQAIPQTDSNLDDIPF